MTPLQIILVRSPCYQDSAQIRGIVSQAETMVGQEFGAQRNTAVALLSLHMLALQERGRTAAGGALTSESEGELARSYAAPASGQTANDWYSLTAWGLEFITLRSFSGPSFLNRRFGTFE